MLVNNSLSPTLRDEIYTLFESSNKDPLELSNQNLIQNYLEIGIFLMNEEAVSSCLVELENEINQVFNDKNIDIKNDIKNDEYTKKSIKNLRNHMVNFLIQFGFSEKIAIPTSILSENEFYNILKNKYLLKDSTFRGVGHGEFTHLLQWYLIADAVQKKIIKLNKPLIDIYTEIGMILKYQTITGLPQSIWDILVDASVLNNQFSKFRSPEYITEYFMNTDREDLKTLSFLFTYRLGLSYMDKHSLKINEEEDENYNVVLDDTDSEEVKRKTYQDKLNEKYLSVKENKTFKYFFDKKISQNVLISNTEYELFKENYLSSIPNNKRIKIK